MGGAHLPYAELVTKSGELKIEVDGTVRTASNVVLTSLNTPDMLGVVAKLNSLLGTWATFTYNENSNQIVVASNTGSNTSTASTSLIEFPEGEMADALGLTQYQGKHVYWSPPETVTDALDTNVQTAVDFTGLVLHKQYRDDTTDTGGNSNIMVAKWAEANNKIFCNTTNNLDVLKSNVSSDIASKLKAASYKNTLTTFSRYPSLYPSAAVFGRASTVNFGVTASTITLNLKQIPGIVAEDLSPSEYASLKSKNASAVIRIGKSVNAYTDSKMASGGYFDSLHGLMWLKNRIEVDQFNLLYRSTTKIPFSQTGINIVKATLERSLQAAVRNGLSASGYTTEGKYLPDGFEVTALPLALVPVDDKSNRTYQSISFEMVGAGALHQVEITGTFTE